MFIQVAEDPTFEGTYEFLTGKSADHINIAASIKTEYPSQTEAIGKTDDINK